jgi:hypothetical protein
MWKKKPEDERTLAVPLGFLEANRGVRVSGVCRSCGAHQPIYLHLLLKEHGKAVTLGAIKGVVPCYFCGERGTLRFLVEER